MNSKHVIFTIGVAFVASALLCGCSSTDEKLAPVSEISEISEDGAMKTAENESVPDRLAPGFAESYEEDLDVDGSGEEWISLDEDDNSDNLSEVFSFATDDNSQIVIVDEEGNVKRVLDPVEEAGIDINKGGYVDTVSGKYFMFHKSVREDGNFRSEMYLYDMSEDTISYVDTVDYFN